MTDERYRRPFSSSVGRSSFLTSPHPIPVPLSFFPPLLAVGAVASSTLITAAARGRKTLHLRDFLIMIREEKGGDGVYTIKACVCVCV